MSNTENMDVAREQLTELFSYAGRIDMPEVFHGCGNWRQMVASRNAASERRRLSKLNFNHMTNDNLGDEAFQLLRAFPGLAATKYSNYSGQHMYPLWYFVLFGYDAAKVESVYEMYPQAISEPLKEWSKGQRTSKCDYLLLEAACSSERVKDDVLIFLANRHPEAKTTSFNHEELPFASRVLDRPKSTGTGHASWAVINAIVPRESFDLRFFSWLSEANYAAHILHRVLDTMIECNNLNKSTSSQQQLEISCCELIDHDRGLVLERLLTHIKGIRVMYCSPKKWTFGGLCQILKCLQSSSLEIVSLSIRPEMILTDGDTSEEALALLEQLFATNESIHTLTLTVDGPYLGAVMKGLAQAPNTAALKKLTLSNMAVPDVSVMTPFLTSVHRKFELLLWTTDVEGQWKMEQQQVLHPDVSIELRNCNMTPQCMVETLNLMPVAKRPGQLVLETFNEGGVADVTESLLNVLNQGYVEKLCVKGGHNKYSVNLFSVFEALRHDMTLRSLELDQSLSHQYQPQQPDGTQTEAKIKVQTSKIKKGDRKARSIMAKRNLQKDPAPTSPMPEISATTPPPAGWNLLHGLLELVKYNAVLEELIVFDGEKKIDYTGFSQNPKIRPMGRIRCKSIHDEAIANQLLHYMQMNWCGRKQVRKDGITNGEVLQALQGARATLRDADKSDIDKFNVLYGFLLESAPTLCTSSN